jgi:hypothetical protein
MASGNGFRVRREIGGKVVHLAQVTSETKARALGKALGSLRTKDQETTRKRLSPLAKKLGVTLVQPRGSPKYYVPDESGFDVHRQFDGKKVRFAHVTSETKARALGKVLGSLRTKDEETTRKRFSPLAKKLGVTLVQPRGSPKYYMASGNGFRVQRRFGGKTVHFAQVTSETKARTLGKALGSFRTEDEETIRKRLSPVAKKLGVTLSQPLS